MKNKSGFLTPRAQKTNKKMLRWALKELLDKFEDDSCNDILPDLRDRAKVSEKDMNAWYAEITGKKRPPLFDVSLVEALLKSTRG